VKGLSYDQWSRCSPYFNHILKETFRLMPVGAIGTICQVGKDFDSGYQGEIIPMGLQITIHCDMNIFGQVANVFILIDGWKCQIL
jgi:hypothetical protein